MRKIAIITGISGQDGRYLAEHLLAKNYKVYGLIRRHSAAETQTTRIDHLMDRIILDYGDVTDASAIERYIRSIQPDELYHLAAQSHVHVSFKLPHFTTDVNALGTLNVIEACRLTSPYCKFYQASSSEMFGNTIDDDGFQRETTPMNPVSPYGCSKLFSYHIVKNYRRAYKLFAVNGILFNHVSPQQGSNFIIAKIIKAAKCIKTNKQQHLVLGNLDAARDFGHAKDYVNAMYLMMNHKKPDDFVIASGKSHTVRDICKYVFNKLDMHYEHYLKQDEKFMRPEELNNLQGDASKAKKILGWKPSYSFNDILDEMIEEIEC